MQEIIEYIEKISKIYIVNDEAKLLTSKLKFLKEVAIFLSENKPAGMVGEIITLGDMKTGYSEYRIIDDCESDDRSLWKEYDAGVEVLRLNVGDLIIKIK